MNIEDPKLIIRDNGVLVADPADVILKKFKFENKSPEEDLNLRIYSSMPAILTIKTPTLKVAKTKSELIKFKIVAP